MINYCRLVINSLIVFWSTSVAIELEYKLNFVIEFISVIGNLTGSIFILSLFYNEGSTLGGWTWYSSLIVLGLYNLLESFTITFLQPNLSRIVDHVQQGTLDYILLKPLNSQIWVSFRFFSPWGLPSFLASIVLIVFGFINSGSNLSAKILLLFLLTCFCALIILYSLWFIIASTSIWFVKVWNANEVLRSTLVAARYPLSSYPIGLRTIFTTIIPIAFLTTVPSQTLLGFTSLSWILSSLLISILSLTISINFWNYALRFYTSASS